MNLLLKVTFNDISFIHVTAHRCAGGLKKKLDLRLGSYAIDIHFVGFFNVSVQATSWANLFTVIPRNQPILVAFYDTHGDRKDLFSSQTPGP